MAPTPVYIVSAVRTPIGMFLGYGIREAYLHIV